MELYLLQLLILGIAIILFIIHKRFKTCGIKSTQLPMYTISFVTFLQWVVKVKMKNVHSLALLFQVLNALQKLFEKEGIFFLRFGFDSYIFVYRPEIVYSLLKNPFGNEKPPEFKILLGALRGGLLTSEGEKWRRKRILLNPAFHMRILQNYISAFNEQSEVLVNKMKKLVDHPWVDMMPLLTVTSLNIICQTAMGIRINVREDDCDIKDFTRASEELKQISMNRILRPWTRYEPLFNLLSMGRKYRKNCDIVYNFSKKVIKEKMESLLAQNKETSDVFERNEGNSILRKEPKVFLDLLLNYHMSDPSFSLKDVQDEVLTFITAGHQTVSCALSWTIYMLGLLQDVQENVFQELKYILGDDMQRPISYEDIKDMTYLDKVIKETMRLYPPVPYTSIKLKEDLEVDNYVIPKGINVTISILWLHKDPKVFPNPEKFDAERFSPKNCKTRPPHHYLPFSLGPRSCIGSKFALMEMKVVLSNLLLNFKFFSLDHRDQIEETHAITLLTTEPLRIKFVRRSRM